MKKIGLIISIVNTSNGAPMGRPNVGTRPGNGTKIFDCRVPMRRSDPAYDRGGVYWGIGSELRVSYTGDLSYIEFYRQPSTI